MVDGYPGLYRDLLTYLKERIKEVLTGGSAAIVVRVYGPDLGALRPDGRGARQGASAGIDGVADLQVEPQVLVPEMQVRLRPEAAAAVRPDARRRAARGGDAGEGHEGRRDLRRAEDLRRRRVGHGAVRATIWPRSGSCGSTLPGGGQVPLGDVADVYIAPSPNVIQRENASRRIDVTCNVKGRDLGGVAREIEARGAGVPVRARLPRRGPGRVRGAPGEPASAVRWASVARRHRCWCSTPTSSRSRLTLLVLLSLPFALDRRRRRARSCRGGVLSLGSLVGFVTVLGIAARNGIMLVSHYRHLRR